MKGASSINGNFCCQKKKKKQANSLHNGSAQCYMTMINILFQRPTP
jgi:hypothetical protein